MITLERAAQITVERIGTLRVNTRRKVEAWLAACGQAGLRIYVYEGLRSCERQAELFAIGRTVRKMAQVVTRAGPGQSMHQYGLAIDFVPLVPEGKAAGMFEAGWNDAKAYAAAHKLAAEHGLRRLSWETPHLEDADYGSWRDAVRAFGNPCG